MRTSGSPIVLDIDGKGFDLTSAEGGVLFDISGTGHPVQMGWTASGTDNAFLALPGADGLVHNGKELFGNFTPQPPSSTPNGFAALAVYDLVANGGNGDGVIDSRDAIFFSLRLWIDANHDGICQPEELHALASLGVTSISLHYSLSRREDQYGNVFRYKALVDPGQPDPVHVGRTAYDVFFVTLASPGTAKNSIPWRASPASAKTCPVPVGADVQVGGEKRLAGVEGLADAPDFAGRNGFWARGNARHAQIDGFASLVSGGILERRTQVIEHVDFDPLWHISSPEFPLTRATQSRICPRCSSLASSCSFLSSRISR